MFTVFTLKLLVISIGTAVSFPASEVRSWPLLDQIQSRAGLLQQTNDNAVPLHNGNVAALNQKADILLQSAESSSSPTPPGSMTNVCDNFCPKWCRKGQLSGERECHYACTNLCDKKVKAANPFIGNPDYEVIASVFNFGAHDVNKDKLISKTEFAQSEMVPMEDVDHLFTFADANSDGYIDHQEYKGGPLLFTVQMAAELSAMAIPKSKDQTESPV